MPIYNKERELQWIFSSHVNYQESTTTSEIVWIKMPISYCRESYRY
jgi:hypothetical protein